jgi:hypothetical protein
MIEKIIEENYYSTASESERDKMRKFILSVLKTNILTVEFKKKDGTLRTMNCTLAEDKVGAYEKKTDKVKTVNIETCPVFDTDINEWRSFRYDTLVSFKFDI